jgi:hypothetical protein
VDAGAWRDLFVSFFVSVFLGMFGSLLRGNWAVAIPGVVLFFCNMGLIFVICIGVLIKLLIGLSLIALGLFWKISGYLRG